MALRVVFAGTPDAAVPALTALAASAHTIVQVLTQPPRPHGRHGTPRPSAVHAAATALGLPVATPADLRAPEALAALEAVRADVGVVVAYGHLLGRAWLGALPHGWINCHFSLLPRWRGAAPVAAAILSGDPTTGVSIIRLVPALDAGPVLAAEATPIGPLETRPDLEARLAALGAPLLLNALAALEAGTASTLPQDPAQVTVAPQLAKAEGLVRWALDADHLARHVRAMQPWPGAYTTAHLSGRDAPLRLTLLEAVPVDAAGDPGTVLDAAAGVVAAGRAALTLRRLQPAGKQPMDWRAFRNGYRVATGDRFG